MQDIRKYIDIVKNEQKPQVGDAFDLEFGKDRAVISTVIEQIIDDAIILKADDKAIDFISKLPIHEDHCGCAMCQGPEEPEHESEHEELDHEVSMGRSQMYHSMKNAKAIHDMLQKVSEREGIEGWVASKLTKASDYLKVVKDYLEYEMVQAGFEKKVVDVEEDDMSTGTVAVGKKGQTRRATGIDDNPYDHNEGEDQTALVNAALWNMKDVYQTLIAGESLSEDDMFSYGDLVQYLEQADMPDHYSKFWNLVVDAINSAGGFKGQGDEIMVDKNIAPTIKTLYQQFKAATANVKGVKEAKYKGKTVKLGKPQRTGTDEPGKFKVYVKDPKTGNVKMVRFGHQGGGKNKDSKTMRIKKSNPARRKSFRARHNCDNPGPRTKARYWSCRAW